MSDDGAIKPIYEQFLKESASDYIGLWAILWEVKEKFPDADPEDARTLTMRIVWHLLNAGAKAGQFVGETFVPWQSAAQKSHVQILDEWAELAREPNIGDIAWFTRLA